MEWLGHPLEETLEDKDQEVILYYSGSTSGISLPERALAADKPAIMLTYWEIHYKKGTTATRFKRHSARRLGKKGKHASKS